MLCNAEIKFRAFLDHALALGADYIATGHYAQVREVDGLYQLLKAEDGTKDQSYFLYRLNQAQLAKTLFPLGGALQARGARDRAPRRPAEPRQDAIRPASASSASGLSANFSTAICPPTRATSTRSTAALVGEHMGLMFYTLGQRQGLGIGGQRDGDGDAWYVVDKDMKRNRLLVVQGRENRALLFEPPDGGRI